MHDLPGRVALPLNGRRQKCELSGTVGDRTGAVVFIVKVALSIMGVLKGQLGIQQSQITRRVSWKHGSANSEKWQARFLFC